MSVGEDAGNATLTITQDAASGLDVTVSYATQNVTAQSPDDYTLTSGTATIPAGSVSATIVVPIVDDTIPEPDELFVVALFNTVNATIDPTAGLALVTIVDNDVVWTLSVADVSVDEAASSAALTISLVPTSSVDVTVGYATSDGTATAPDDYTASSGTATIPAGMTSATVSIPIAADAIDESGSGRYRADAPSREELHQPGQAEGGLRLVSMLLPCGA